MEERSFWGSLLVLLSYILHCKITYDVAVQSFLRDAEQLESVTASDEAFLDFDDLGVSVRMC